MTEYVESIKQQKGKESRKCLGNNLGAPENTVVVQDTNFTKKGVVSLPFVTLFGPCLAGAPGPKREPRLVVDTQGMRGMKWIQSRKEELTSGQATRKVN